MGKEADRKNVEDVLYLMRCAVTGTVAESGRIAAMDLAELYQSAGRHGVLSAVGMALQGAGVQDETFKMAVARAQRKNALLDADRAAVTARMEEAGIWYMPLKGSILKDLYPRFGMREMADNDILFDKERAKDLRELMKELGFTVESYGWSAHDVYYKKPVSNFEMHRELFSQFLDLHKYYANVKDRLVTDEGRQYGYRFTDEDFYLYLVAHEYKHYSKGGTGLRSLMDTYVCLTSKTLDMDYVQREAKKIGIADFERRNRELALHLFNGEQLIETEWEILGYMESSGAYGTVGNEAANQVAEKGRWGYFLSRLTLPRDVMETLFPVLKKAPFLYPFCWALRLARGVFLNNKRFRIQLKAALGLDKEKDD